LYIGVIPRFGHNFSNVYRANIEDQELLVNNDSLNELDRNGGYWNLFHISCNTQCADFTLRDI